MNEFSTKERLACKILSNLQWDKSIPNNNEFYDNFFNNSLIWFCQKILKVDVVNLINRVLIYDYMRS